MNEHVLTSQKQYVNIYLFSSLSKYDKETENKLKRIVFNDNDCIVIFNNPSLYVQTFLKNRNKRINYCFCRGFDIHLTRTQKIIKNNIVDLKDTDFIHESFQNKDTYFKPFSNFNLRHGITINNDKVDHLEYFKKIGYVPSTTGKYSPSIGFKSVIILNLLYPNVNFYLIGFDYVKNKVVSKGMGHNHKFENEYLKKNIIHFYL